MNVPSFRRNRLHTRTAYKPRLNAAALWAQLKIAQAELSDQRRPPTFGEQGRGFAGELGHAHARRAGPLSRLFLNRRLSKPPRMSAHG